MIVYKTTNLINGKIYIGQDSNADPKYFGSGNLLKKAFKKYGIESFKKEILEECTSKKDLNDKEKYWINFFNSTNKKIGYNISEGGTGGKLTIVEWKKGKTYEEAYGEEKAKEIKNRLSEKRKGKKRNFVNITPEDMGKKISASLHALNIERTDEYKKNVSKGVKKFYETEEGKKNKEKLREAKTGVKQTDESNKKRSQSLKGKRPKQLEVHPSAKYWYFYNYKNELILQSLGNMKFCFEKLKINHRHIKKFSTLEECLNYSPEKNIKYKVFIKKYYEK
jgi:group I intron endonuclease